ncbi:uncharacterized protein AKAME5_001962700 [Lates japonicus]|uniref:Uncharacterized protein n=1 Tax=Lates japonicus TaxID=270547 RepID=A0AAD3NB87_LATJO|nr:uncharacterized protein AKAME5_001962700 [Lates japonicus]
MRSFFDESLNGITESLREILGKDLSIEFILLVGGFAESKILRRHIDDQFGRQCKVLCPFRAQEAVVKGAVKFGRNPEVVASRKSAFTYGIAVSEEFDESRHKAGKKFTADGREMCRDIFMKLVEIDENTDFDFVQERRNCKMSIMEQRDPDHGHNLQDSESTQNAVQPQTAGEPDPTENPQDTGLTEMERLNQEKLQEARSALKQKDEELKSFKDRMTEMERLNQEKLQEARSALNQKDEELKSFKDRSALKQKEEELNSFKDRVAADLTVSIKTGDTESMNNPVSKIKLTEMYNKLKLLQWPKIKDHLKSNAVSREFTKDLTQKMFKDAAEEMERKKKQIDEVFGLIENSSGLTPQKVKEFRQLTIHSLQMDLYHSRKEDLLQRPFLDDKAQYSQDVMVNFRLLASECYWLGCLMALNSPPLQPDWENHVPGLDTWDIFPRDIKSV